VSTGQTSNQNPWIDDGPDLAGREGRIRLFCLPYVGGSSVVFKQWHHYSSELEICAVRLPGREPRMAEAPFDRLGPLVQTLTEVLPFDKPFALFGHSMGALVAFELARKLRHRNMPAPLHLFVSARRAPQSTTPARKRHLLPTPQFIQALRELGGTPEAVLKDSSLMELMIPLLRADFALVETYEYKQEATLSCPITVFGGDADRDVPFQELCEWKEQTHNEFRLQIFQGDHFYLLHREAEVAGKIAGSLRAFSKAYAYYHPSLERDSCGDEPNTF
jgi:surfactin synthase thioesterase subunit